MLEYLNRLEDIPLGNQRVLVRADLDLDMDGSGAAVASERLQRLLPTLKHIVEREARLIIASHRGDARGKVHPGLSMEPVGMELARMTGWEVLLPDGPTSEAARKVIADLRSGQVCLLENLRYEPGEDAADETFAHALAQLCDVYVIDSLNLLTRELASVVVLPRLVRHKTVGLALRADLEAIERLRMPPRPVLGILGGRKFSDQLEQFETLMDRANALCLGGGLANTVLAATGQRLGRTEIETSSLAQARALLERAERAQIEVLLPTDLVVAEKPRGSDRQVFPVAHLPEDRIVVDLGPETIARYGERCTRAATVIATGPMGQPLFDGVPSERELYRTLGCSTGFKVALGGAAASAAGRALGGEEGKGSSFDLIAHSAKPVWQLLRGARLPGLQSLR